MTIGDVLHVCCREWSWKKFFVSLGLFILITSAFLWWYSGRFPYSAQEVRYRLLMIQYESLRSDLDRLYMNADSYSVNKFRAQQKIAHLCESFEEFLYQYPNDGEAMTAYGFFLDEIGKNNNALFWRKRAMSLSGKNPEILNDLANGYGNVGDAKQAIRLYEEAIRLNPCEPIYHFNLANMYYLFRKETHAIHGWDLDKTFRNSLDHFRVARELAPKNIQYATSYAETFYGVKFLSKNFDWNEAQEAWQHCLNLKNKAGYQDAVRVHLVRINAYQGKILEALEWHHKIQSPQNRQISWQILYRFFPEEMGNEI